MSTFVHVTSRLGKVRPETRDIALEVYNAAKKAGHSIWFMWGMGTSPEHATGLALDWMVRSNAAGDFIRNYLWTHRKRLRLKHVIWEQRITSTVVRPGVVKKMEDRGDSTANHFDHVHSLHFEGPYREVLPTPTKPSMKSVDVIAAEVIRGRWGNGDDRRNRLTRAGYKYTVVQGRVNEMLRTGGKKSVDRLAREVLRGDWGNGVDRRNRLTKAGYNYGAVQARVNSILKNGG